MRAYRLPAMLCLFLLPACDDATAGDDGGADLARHDFSAAAPDGSDAGCGLRTCASAGANCGPIGDGCGGVMDCGSCPGGQFCGGGGPSRCGDGACMPRDCKAQGIACGPAGDGCGGVIADCGACPMGETCGGGGKPSQCGQGKCTPLDCVGQKAGCGPIADGCGGMIDCGKCPMGKVCGTAGPNVCGPPPCVPKTCKDLGIACGPSGDGCGGVIDCGGCPMGQSCGGSGKPFVCGVPPALDGGFVCAKKMTCLSLGITCGPAGDGCGAMLDCGKCALPDTCGGGGKPFACGHPPMCAATTCKALGYQCGPAGDGCGGLLQCGACPQGEACGSGGKPGVCGGGGGVDGGVQLGGCDGGGTTVSGVVHAPNGMEPLYNALVYTSALDPPAFAKGAACGTCGKEAGTALTSMRTGPDGIFHLTVPSGTRWLVIQIGRWRRKVDLTKLKLIPCIDNPLAADSTRMPKNPIEGDIPLMAMVTGKVDSLECVLRKIGIDDAQFTTPAGGGRVQFYVANGADAGNGTPSADQLFAKPAPLPGYDMVLLACEGAPMQKPAPEVMALDTYAGMGGRVFATHYSYTWLDDPNTSFQGTAAWVPDSPHPTANDQTPLVGLVEQNPAQNPKGKDFATWLHLVGADGAMPGTVSILASRHDLNTVKPPSVRWIYTDQPQTIQHYTFDTPIVNGKPGVCGRVLFSDFHVSNVMNTTGKSFPAECTPGPLSAQEKVLEFMLFDLASCVGQQQLPSCTPRTCKDQGIACGPAGDGCGNLIQGGCGDCPMGQSCGGGGVPSQCGAPPSCTPKTCQQQGLACGPAGDGCGKAISCGPCAPAPDGGVCAPKPCAPADCGPTADGCGNLIPGGCGPCVNPCVPLTCKQLGFNCGPTADGCGKTIDCGICTPPQFCGGGGSPNVCGGVG